jgi:hypothetical protein
MIVVQFRCPKCKETVSVPEEYDEPYVWCHNCLTRIGVPAPRSQPVLWPSIPARATTRPPPPPWSPWQVLASSFLFGPLAGGVVTGINFARTGKRVSLRPWILVIPWSLAGAVLFGLLALGAILQPAAAALQAAVANLIIATYFALVTVRPFEAWKATNMSATTKRDQSRSGRLGQLLLIGVSCLAVELAIVGLLVLLI